MNDAHGSPEAHDNLEQLGAALQAGDRDAVMACFSAGATVCQVSGEDQIVLTGSRIADAVDALLCGFDHLKLTPSARLVSNEGIVEESVVSGDHTGMFAGAEPTGRRVSVNVKLSVTWGPDWTLQSLRVEGDSRALFAQIAETNDVMGVAGGLMAIVRERHSGVVHVTDKTGPQLPAARALSGPGHPRTSRRRWVIAVAAAVALFAVALTWRNVSETGSMEATLSATNAASAARPATPSAKVGPKPVRVTQPKPSAKPVIATADPKVPPHVQAGRQVVLRSDVLFAFDSAALTPTATAALSSLAQHLRDTNVVGTIQINGYTDNTGTAGYDLALSKSRALAVADVLQGAMVGRHVTLVPQGFGDANPIALNTSAAGQAVNRRVTIVLPVT